jgi:hypothetical protein
LANIIGCGDRPLQPTAERLPWKVSARPPALLHHPARLALEGEAGQFPQRNTITSLEAPVFSSEKVVSQSGLASGSDNPDVPMPTVGHAFLQLEILDSEPESVVPSGHVKVRSPCDPPSTTSLSVPRDVVSVCRSGAGCAKRRHVVPPVVTVKLQGPLLPDAVRGLSNVTTAPLAYVHVLPSALVVPCSPGGGTQRAAAAAVDFQQLSALMMYAQSSNPSGVDERADREEQASTASAKTTTDVREAMSIG